MAWEDNVNSLHREMEAMERGAISMEKAMEREADENYRLRQQIQEQQAEINRLLQQVNSLEETLGYKLSLVPVQRLCNCK